MLGCGIHVNKRNGFGALPPNPAPSHGFSLILGYFGYRQNKPLNRGGDVKGALGGGLECLGNYSIQFKWRTNFFERALKDRHVGDNVLSVCEFCGHGVRSKWPVLI